MTGADQVKTSLFHLPDLSYLSRIEGHSPEHAIVVMHTGTIDQQRFPVEHKATLGIIRERADAETRTVLVDDNARLL